MVWCAGFESPGDCVAADNRDPSEDTSFWCGEQRHAHAQGDRGKTLGTDACSLSGKSVPSLIGNVCEVVTLIVNL